MRLSVNTEAKGHGGRRGNRPLLAALLLAVGGFYLLADGALGEGPYMLTVDEAVGQAVDASRPVRVTGTVVEGTYAPGDHHRFTLRGAGRTIDVRYVGPLPEMFEEGGSVVVEGVLDGTGFEAYELVARCPCKYSPRARTASAAEPASSCGRS